MLSGGSPLREFQLGRRLGIYILMMELVLLPVSLTLGVNHLSWRWQVCNVITSFNSLMSPLLLPGAAWLALPPSNWRTAARFFTLAIGVLYIPLALLVAAVVCLFIQPPGKELVVKNGDIISISYYDTGATGGGVCVSRHRPHGPFRTMLESRTLGFCEPTLTILPDGKQMLSGVGETPVDIDQFFLSGDK